MALGVVDLAYMPWVTVPGMNFRVGHEGVTILVSGVGVTVLHWLLARSHCLASEACLIGDAVEHWTLVLELPGSNPIGVRKDFSVTHFLRYNCIARYGTH